MVEKIPYDLRKVEIVHGIMAAFAQRSYNFNVDIKINAGDVHLIVTDFVRGEVKDRAEQHIDVWSLPSDQHPYVFGHKAAMTCICKIEHAKGNCVS